MQRAPTVSLTSDKTDRPKTDHLSYNEDIQGHASNRQVPLGHRDENSCIPWSFSAPMKVQVQLSCCFRISPLQAAQMCLLHCCLSTFHVVTPYVWLLLFLSVYHIAVLESIAYELNYSQRVTLKLNIVSIVGYSINLQDGTRLSDSAHCHFPQRAQEL